MKKILSLGVFIIFLFLFNINRVYAIRGIDVSEWQGEINFEDVKNDDIEIVYIRSSAGNSYIDSKFLENYEEARKNGFKIGVYHYVTARNAREAEEQAVFFASLINGKDIDCRLAMDFEALSGLSKDEIIDIALSFLTKLEELTNKELVIYSDAYNAVNIFQELLSDYPLWVAEYDVESPSVKDYVGWQYSDKGRIQGIDGYVDLDEFDSDIYLSDASTVKVPDVKKDDEEKTVYYQVKKGDTLSKIASKYNVTVYELIRWNNLVNPNLIYPGEIIKIEVNYKYSVTSSNENDTYIVKKGDTLSKIAKEYGVTVNNLVTWNKIVNPNLIYPNEKIIIKRINNDHAIRYLVNNDDTLLDIANNYKVSLYELININKINKIKTGDIIYIPESYILER